MMHFLPGIVTGCLLTLATEHAFDWLFSNPKGGF